MTHGKNICNQLKEVRKRIAEENDIPLEIEECTYKGECRGTCPRCEAEVRYLENALADRLRLGKVATVAGLALGLAATAAQAQAPATAVLTTPQGTDTTHKVMATGVLKGRTLDAKTGEALPFCHIVVKQDGRQVNGGTSDFDGMYIIKSLPAGTYTLEISSPGYGRFVREGIRVLPTGFTMCDVELISDSAATQEKPYIFFMGEIADEPSDTSLQYLTKPEETPLIEEPPLMGAATIKPEDIIPATGNYVPDPNPANPPFQVFEKEGVKVIVR